MLTSFKEKAKKIMEIVRLTDKEGLVSLTNITMMLVIYKIAMTPAVSFQELTALAIGVLGYQAKRVISK